MFTSAFKIFLLSKLLLLLSFLALISISKREREKDYHYIPCYYIILPHIPLFSISSMYTSPISEGEKK